MMDNKEIGIRDRVLSSTEKNECPTECVVDPSCTPEMINVLNKSYKSWNTLGMNAFSALSIGTCLLSVLTINGVLSLLSCNSVFSILSLNSAFSVLSTNSAFAVGCVDKRFAICF